MGHHDRREKALKKDICSLTHRTRRRAASIRLLLSLNLKIIYLERAKKKDKDKLIQKERAKMKPFPHFTDSQSDSFNICPLPLHFSVSEKDWNNSQLCVSQGTPSNPGNTPACWLTGPLSSEQISASNTQKRDKGQQPQTMYLDQRCWSLIMLSLSVL